MIKEEQRIAIAEACGWKNQKYSERSPQAMWCNPGGVPIGFLPDYLSDLNAMHEAEKVLTHRQCFDYRDLLQDMVNPHEEIAENSKMFVFGATAAQRAEAFLRTLGKWKD